jgi:KDO2-lipid IV(A) lauroyltransferase
VCYYTWKWRAKSSAIRWVDTRWFEPHETIDEFMSGFKKIRFYIEYAGVAIVKGIVRLLPFRLAVELGAAAGWNAYRVFRIRRGVSKSNIKRSLPAVTSDAEADRIACESYMNMGRSMMEFAKFDRLGVEEISAKVDFVGTEFLDRALEVGKGAILFSGHLGNWELLGAAIAAIGYPIREVVGRQSNQIVDATINDLRRRQVLETIHRETGLKQVVRALGRNEFVAIVADQDARNEGIFVDFLGQPASTHKGPATFAVRRGAPVIPGFIHRTAGGRHRAEFGPLMWPDAKLDEANAVHELVQRYTDALTAKIREHPTEYFWAHRRWKTKPA